MEVLPSYSAEKLRNTRRVSRNFVRKPSENFAPVNNNNIHGGLLFAPPPPSIYFSYPPPASLMNQNHQQINHRLSGQQQPPLLPLPNSPPLHRSLPARIKPITSSPPIRKTNRSNNQSLAPKKSKSKPIASKVEEPKKDPKPAETDASANPIDRDLKKDMLNRSPSSLIRSDPDDFMKDLEISPESGIFSLSPPPSSLPLPKFALRRKLNCKAEAAGNDNGVSDDLRRMLRLH